MPTPAQPTRIGNRRRRSLCSLCSLGSLCSHRSRAPLYAIPSCC